MKFVNANKVYRKSGVAKWRDLQFLFSTLQSVRRADGNLFSLKVDNSLLLE
jgi:hypothetical protein